MEVTKQISIDIASPVIKELSKPGDASSVKASITQLVDIGPGQVWAAAYDTLTDPNQQEKSDSFEFKELKKAHRQAADALQYAVGETKLWGPKEMKELQDLGKDEFLRQRRIKFASSALQADKPYFLDRLQKEFNRQK